ncbi:MAG: aminotransferase class I/II-fold pyridoxal phosphate-dependent enzyme [Betaproteobacteria bacterium]|nr:aminotransferase class I/II-fold pyridoxal phosphate-dependent enzyme [Betaproteobacteria bacterium]MBI2226272.1 aminotransferase class I/II-fold pyridoxal phosphate-dependent enzyme [Betaproteobacteria bacterium]MBI2288746.1 aminotransferase class I/II-fold pyridoxal phosphate-dependent enzyme [Betaproteobacteria bacterium]MBI3055023.1 aminotransferase class I/II-fold pyridoxal phosphate-dependent enzyme [Betaproteobacteria bacterium]
MTAVRSLAARVATLQPSATVEMSERVRNARAAGKRILGLSSGDPNIPTDPRIIAAAERSLRRGDTLYSAPAGLLPLREAIAGREARLSGIAIDPADVLITPGGKFAVLAALMATVSEGDEVLVPDPGWVSYGPCVSLCGGAPVAVPCLNGYDAVRLESAITPRTRAIIVNSPANPSTHVATQAELQAILAVAERHDLWIIFDQVYAEMNYAEAIPRLQSLPGARARTFIADSLSKTFGMTGWRIGMLIPPPGLAKAIVRFIGHSIYCVPPFVQAAAIEAFNLADEIIPAIRETFRKRIAVAAPRLNNVQGITCAASRATFYLFPKVAADERVVAKRWLDEGGIAVLPGSAFGDGGKTFLRISLACSDAELDEALTRIERFGIGA